MNAVNIGAQMGPDFRIEVDNHDITENFRSRLISLVINDKLGLELDTFTLVLDDSDGQVILPRRGSVLHISIGWQGEALFNKGAFELSGVSHAGAPDTLTLTGFSYGINDSLKEIRTNSYDGMMLSEIVQFIAVRGGLQALLPNDLAVIKVDHVDQTKETDLQFISRLAQRYDAIASIKAGHLMLLSPGNGTTANGRPLDRATIRRREGDKYNFVYTGDADYIGAKADWHSLDKAGTKTVTIKAVVEPPGNVFDTPGSRYLVLPTPYKSQEEAKQALATEWKKSRRSSATLTFMLARGRPELIPEMWVHVEGFKALIDKYQWFITNVDHTINAGGGLTSSVTLEILLKMTFE